MRANSTKHISETQMGNKIELSQAYVEYRKTLLRYKIQHRNKKSGQTSLYSTFTVSFNILLITTMANLLR